MTHKLQCPVCHAMTTEQTEAFEQGDVCSNCGCPAETAVEIFELRQRHSDSELKERYEMMLVENAQLRVRNESLTTRLVQVRALLDGEIYG